MQGLDKDRRNRLLEGRRKALELTLDEMAERTGLTRTKLQRHESDAANLPNPADAAAICAGYNIAMAELVQAAGYDLGQGDIRGLILRGATPGEIFSVRYGLSNEDADALEGFIQRFVAERRARLHE